MKKLLLLIVVLALAPAPLHAQQDSVTVEIGPAETCPVGWTTTDRAWTRPARMFYLVPAALTAAYALTHVGGVPEFQVSLAFVISVFPTAQLREAAFTAGRLRAEPAASGIVRTCTIGT